MSFALTALPAAVGGYAFGFEPEMLLHRQYKLTTHKWPTGFDPLKIVFASDFHVGCPSVALDDAEAIVQKINDLQPDLIALGGDYLVQDRAFYSHVPQEPIAAVLSKLQAPLGVYASLGNHDWYSGGKRMEKALEDNGIHVMENRALHIERDGGSFWMAGLGDDTTQHTKLDRTIGQIGNNDPTIMLAHDPASFIEINERPVLTLSGHTHGGQVIIPGVSPLYFPGRAPLKYAYGHIAEGGRDLIVSSGLGTSGIPARFGCPPEIVEIIIQPAELALS